MNAPRGACGEAKHLRRDLCKTSRPSGLRVASIPIRGPERKQRTKRPRLLYRPGEGWARKQPRAVGAQHREGLGNWVYPVRIEERGRRGTVRQCEVRAHSPGPAGKLPFEPGVGALQLFRSKRQSFLALHWITRQSTVYCVLRRVHYVEVEEAVEEAYVQRGHRVRWQQAHGPGTHVLKVLDDDAGLDDVALAVHQQRKLA